MPRSTLITEARARRHACLEKMSPDDLVALSMRLGSEAVRAYADQHQVSLVAARRALRRSAQRGRQPSSVMRGLDG